MKLLCTNISFHFSRGKWTNLAIHSGFDEMSCYGDITLEIQHRPDSLTPEDRKELKKISLASSDSDKEIAERCAFQIK